MKNNLVAITGVCGGIGSEIARQLIRGGYSIIGIDINEEKLNSFKNEYPDNFFIYQADLINRESRIKVSEEIFSEKGIPDIWINNAGMAYIDLFLDTPQDDFDNVMELNLLSYIDLTRYWLSKMNEQNMGTIVNIASCAGHMTAPYFSSYSASKFGVVGFTEAIQQELNLKKSPLKMVLVSPGFVRTEIVKLGEDKGFPKELSFILESPESCAKEIIEGILKGSPFINPTFNGKFLMAFSKITPDLFKASSKIFFINK